MDMLSGYFQKELDDATSFMTTFITPWGKFRYRRAPMGLAPSSYWFNAFMQELVMNLDGVDKSMDNFLANAPTLEKLEETPRKFFENCKKLGVTISAKKFKASTRVHFGGTIINPEGEKIFLESNPGKLKRILDFAHPNNKDELLSFLGLIKTLQNGQVGCLLSREK